MSHFTTVETKIKDLVCLKAALKDLGYAFAESEQGVTVKGYLGQTETAALSIHASKTYDVGVKATATGYEFVADWWGVETTRGLTQEAFVRAIAANAERLRSSIRSLVPVAGTPLYTVAKAAYDEMQQGYDPTKINAVILLTDGANEDGDDSDDRRQLNELVESLRASSTGELARPIRMFTVGYGQGAQTDVLNQIASASAGAAYNAKDASTISKVFEQVVSNF